MDKLLVGATGFVGSTLQNQKYFDCKVHSKNLQLINNNEFDLVVCSAAPAKKWLANQNPEDDRANINKLITSLKTISCQQFILISTVDVFNSPIKAYEESSVDEVALQGYGLHRRFLELFSMDHFKKAMIVRLPGLVGTGLRKNIIFDFLNQNNLNSIDSRGSFQFYPMKYLWRDITIALDANLDLIHLTAEPVTVAEVGQYAFDKDFKNQLSKKPAKYDLRTLYAKLYNKQGEYQYNQIESLAAIKEYALTEAISL